MKLVNAWNGLMINGGVALLSEDWKLLMSHSSNITSFSPFGRSRVISDRFNFWTLPVFANYHTYCRRCLNSS